MALSCETCGKTFTATALQKHKARKVPCVANEFRETSNTFNKSLSKEIRKQEGIYFTPKKARSHLFSTLAELHINPSSILEPSFGTGEFLQDAHIAYPEATLVGVEKNETLFQSLIEPQMNLSCSDFLTWSGPSTDLIIGNPPYFVIKTTHLNTKQKKEFALQHSNCLSGRPNIYVMFMYKCLSQHLNPGGHLAFIIPSSIYSCSYYQPLRNYIQETCTILHVENLDKPGFFETGQETILIVLQKTKLNDNYIFKARNGCFYISPHYNDLYHITKNTTTLSELGLGVKTGNVIWNEVKSNLADEGTLLIYSSNLNHCELTLNNLCGTKKQYVTNINKPVLSGPVILVERGYGNTFHFNFALVNLPEFYAENHINVIYPKTPESGLHLEKVVKSFQNEKNKLFIEWFLGNGSVSATDLETIFPIF